MFCDSVIVDLPFGVNIRFCSVVVAPSRYLLYYWAAESREIIRATSSEKRTFVHAHPSKIQISLRSRIVRSESSKSAF